MIDKSVQKINVIVGPLICFWEEERKKTKKILNICENTEKLD